MYLSQSTDSLHRDVATTVNIAKVNLAYKSPMGMWTNNQNIPQLESIVLSLGALTYSEGQIERPYVQQSTHLQCTDPGSFRDARAPNRDGLRSLLIRPVIQSQGFRAARDPLITITTTTRPESMAA